MDNAMLIDFERKCVPDRCSKWRKWFGTGGRVCHSLFSVSDFDRTVIHVELSNVFFWW